MMLQCKNILYASFVDLHNAYAWQVIRRCSDVTLLCAWGLVHIQVGHRETLGRAVREASCKPPERAAQTQYTYVHYKIC